MPEDVDIPVIYKQKDKDWVDTIPKPSDEKQEGKKGKQSTNGFIHRWDLAWCGQKLLNYRKIATFTETL